ncbi:MAG: hypothetical protein ACUVXI_16905 [bacterium]
MRISPGMKPNVGVLILIGGVSIVYVIISFLTWQNVNWGETVLREDVRGDGGTYRLHLRRGTLYKAILHLEGINYTGQGDYDFAYKISLSREGEWEWSSQNRIAVVRDERRGNLKLAPQSGSNAIVEAADIADVVVKVFRAKEEGIYDLSLSLDRGSSKPFEASILVREGLIRADSGTYIYIIAFGIVIFVMAALFVMVWALRRRTE